MKETINREFANQKLTYLLITGAECTPLSNGLAFEVGTLVRYNGTVRKYKGLIGFVDKIHAQHDAGSSISVKWIGIKPSNLPWTSRESFQRIPGLTKMYTSSGAFKTLEVFVVGGEVQRVRTGKGVRLGVDQPVEAPTDLPLEQPIKLPTSQPTVPPKFAIWSQEGDDDTKWLYSSVEDATLAAKDMTV